MFQQPAPIASADYRLVFDHDSPRDGFSSGPTLIVELSPSNSSEEQSSETPTQLSSNNPYSPTVLAFLKTGSAQAHDLVKMNFTKTSNLLFLVGAFCQLLVAIWDLKDAKDIAFKATALDGNPADDNDYTITATDKASYLFYTLGPALYGGKALLDIRRSLQARSHSRNDQRWNVVAGVIFCLGAMFAIYDSILYDAHEEQDDADDDGYLLAVATSRSWFGSEFKMNIISTHLYLISGAIFLSLHTGCFHGWQQILSINAPPLQLAYRILICGTICFVMGAIMDALLSYFYDPQILDKIDHDDAIPATDLGLAKAKFASTFLWTLAPTMYILVDVLVQRYLKDRIDDSMIEHYQTAINGNEVAPFL